MLLTAGLAPVVALVLIGLSRIQRDTPEWVYWKAELIFLIAVKIAYQVTAFLSLIGALVLGFLLFRGSGRGNTPPVAGPRIHALDRPPFQPGTERGRVRGLALVVTPRHGRARRRPRERRARRPLHAVRTSLWELSLRRISPIRPVTTHRPGRHGRVEPQGVPYDRWLSIGKIIAWKLQKAIPGRPISLNVIARAGDTLEIQHKLLCNLQRCPDLLIIYSGHNEFYSRSGGRGTLTTTWATKFPLAGWFSSNGSSSCHPSAC